jgi:hypothetical protein
MTQKPSYAALLRKIERLEAELAETRADRDKVFRHYADCLSERAQLKMRVEQAQRLLAGEDA